MRNESPALALFPPNWVQCYPVHLGAKNETDYVVMGIGPLLGANVTSFWVYRLINEFPVLVMQAPEFAIELLKTRHNGLLDIQLSSATAVTLNEVILRFDGRRYVRSRSSLKALSGQSVDCQHELCQLSLIDFPNLSTAKGTARQLPSPTQVRVPYDHPPSDKLLWAASPSTLPTLTGIDVLEQTHFAALKDPRNPPRKPPASRPPHQPVLPRRLRPPHHRHPRSRLPGTRTQVHLRPRARPPRPSGHRSPHRRIRSRHENPNQWRSMAPKPPTSTPNSPTSNNSTLSSSTSRTPEPASGPTKPSPATSSKPAPRPTWRSSFSTALTPSAASPFRAQLLMSASKTTTTSCRSRSATASALGELARYFNANATAVQLKPELLDARTVHIGEETPETRPPATEPGLHASLTVIPYAELDTVSNSSQTLASPGPRLAPTSNLPPPPFSTPASALPSRPTSPSAVAHLTPFRKPRRTLDQICPDQGCRPRRLSHRSVESPALKLSPTTLTIAEDFRNRYPFARPDHPRHPLPRHRSRPPSTPPSSVSSYLSALRHLYPADFKLDLVRNLLANAETLSALKSGTRPPPDRCLLVPRPSAASSRPANPSCSIPEPPHSPPRHTRRLQSK